MNFISPEPGGWNILHPQFVLGETEAGTTRNPEWVELIRKEPVLFYPGYSIRGKSGSTPPGLRDPCFFIPPAAPEVMKIRLLRSFAYPDFLPSKKYPLLKLK